MKKQLLNEKRNAGKNLFYLLICSASLLFCGCEKADLPPAGSAALNAQEKVLKGKWTFKRSEIFEISGVDSNGNYICTLVGASNCDSIRTIEFKDIFMANNAAYKGSGTMGSCSQAGSFTWSAKQNGKLKYGGSTVYDIVYLTNDSAAFSNVYVKDILTLKSVYYYKRN